MKLIQLKYNLLYLIFSATIISANAGIIYVNVNAVGANNGNSWVHAYTRINDALAHASSGDQIWIAKGTYNVNDEYDHQYCNSSSINLRDGITLYGSLIGTENIAYDMNNRNFALNPTYISGDANNNGIIDEEDAAILFTFSGVSTNVTVLDGLQLTLANRVVKLRDGHLTFRNCRISQFRGDGGIIGVEDGILEITDCVIEENEIDDWGGVIRSINATVDVYSTFFNNNTNYGKKCVFASVLLPETSTCNFNNSVFYGNTSTNEIPFDGQGTNSTLTIKSCSFDNSSLEPANNYVYFSTCSLINTIIWEADMLDDILGSATTNVLINCVTPSGYTGTSLQHGNPNFLGPDLSIDNTSSAWDNGDDTYNSLLTDIVGNDRVSDTDIDIGAYEFCVNACSRLSRPDEEAEVLTDLVEFLVYPNPADDIVFLKLTDSQHISIFDLNGKLMYDSRLNKGIQQVDISEFSPGVYFVRSQNSPGPVKLVVN